MYHLASLALLSSVFLHASSAYEEPRGLLHSYRRSSSTPTVITEDFDTFVQGVLNETGVKGLALGIVKPDGSLEFGSWGNRTEDGDPVTSDVGVS